ncbi:hypothetical protein [Erythrobacter sp. YT30]|uniref:hypothetical protein n=1 Tax=Erythrobacter sp. YT30 TaxID=1735012 RepID=UPI00076DC4D5|nr:hypothetical protein [Erythrobacter sp. YT30]KWV93282.1 hypothetical protein AUC45_03995 [Erythrobacter sp. YT30]
MTIHFAPAKSNRRGTFCPKVERMLSRVSLGTAANDNGRTRLRQGAFVPPSQDILEAALRHFAEYGLGAARAARMRAKQAFFEGDRAAYDWWIGITQTLDRRLADQTLHHQAEPGIAANSDAEICVLAPEKAR